MATLAEADSPAPPRPTVLICTNCKAQSGANNPGLQNPDAPLPGTQLADAGEAEAAISGQVDVLRVRCLANCSRGPSVAIRHPGTWTYIFGNIDPAADAPALIAGARLLAESTDGLMPWRGRPDCLKRGLIARIPPLDFTGEPA